MRNLRITLWIMAVALLASACGGEIGIGEQVVQGTPGVAVTQYVVTVTPLPSPTSTATPYELQIHNVEPAEVDAENDSWIVITGINFGNWPRVYLDGSQGSVFLDTIEVISLGTEVRAFVRARMATGRQTVRLVNSEDSSLTGTWEALFLTTPIPVSADYWRAEYYADTSLEELMWVAKESTIRIGPATQTAPRNPLNGEQLNTDAFGVRYRRLYSGSCTARASHVDDGYRLYVGGRLIRDEWHVAGGNSYDNDFTANQEEVVIEYFENGGQAGLEVTITCGRVAQPTPRPQGPAPTQAPQVDEEFVANLRKTEQVSIGPTLYWDPLRRSFGEGGQRFFIELSNGERFDSVSYYSGAFRANPHSEGFRSCRCIWRVGVSYWDGEKTVTVLSGWGPEAYFPSWGEVSRVGMRHRRNRC